MEQCERLCVNILPEAHMNMVKLRFLSLQFQGYLRGFNMQGIIDPFGFIVRPLSQREIEQDALTLYLLFLFYFQFFPLFPAYAVDVPFKISAPEQFRDHILVCRRNRTG